MSHIFEVETRWTEGFRGEATPAGVARAVPFAVPKEFGGPGGEWTPEHFLATAVNSCVLATFLSIAQMSKLPIAGYESRASCTMEKGPEGLRITSVKLSPRILVTAEKDVERARRMIEKAENLCPISNSLKPGVALEATVEVAG
jgi:organic hydroperoxide reductase OsmC/OhrA